MQSESIKYSYSSNSLKIDTALALKGIFNTYPQKIWSSTELENRLKRMIDSGNVITNVENFLNYSHNILKDLVEQEYIEIVNQAPQIRYQKKSND